MNCDILNSIKWTSWLINKGMCVLLFDGFKQLLWRKTDLLKTCRKSKFLGKKIWRNAPALKSKKVQGIFRKSFFSERKLEEMHQLWRAIRYKVYSGKCFFWRYYHQMPLSAKPCFQISFKLFCSGDKRLLSEFLRKRG